MSELEIREKPEETTKVVQRIASLDFQRGLAIWMMVFLHVFNHIYDYSWVDSGLLFSGQPGYDFFRSLFFAFSAFFGNWVGYFILISAIVNAYATTKKALAGFPPGRLFGKQILTGLGILLAGVVTESFGYYGYFGSVFRSGETFTAAPWIDPDIVAKLWERFFLMEALQIIGWCMIITAIIQYFLFIKGGAEKFVRNIIILGSLTIVILVLSPVIWYFVDNMSYWKQNPALPVDDYNNNWPSDEFQAYNHGIVSWILTIIAGDYYPLFPFLSTSLLGAVMGTALSIPKPAKRLPVWGGVLTLGIFVLAVISIFALPFDISFNRPYMGFYLILLGVQVGIIVLLFYLIDWRGKGAKFAKNIVVKYFRTWGMIALTIFALQIWSLVPRAVFNWTYPENLMSYQFGLGQEWIVLIFAVVTVLFYDLLIWLWAQTNFFMSFEWFIIRFSSLASKEPSKRLNFKFMLREVNWMNYLEIRPEKTAMDTTKPVNESTE
ncbi:MAG: hypothetical protein FK734_11465 [Asgard group archaeon]|nr:hypothetical protein [Asgard group archaeon]